MVHSKFILPCLLLFFANYASAQQLTPQTISTAGNSSSSGNILLESSVGGLVVAPISTGSFMYTPDFLQPDVGITTSIPVINNITLSTGAGIDNAGTTFVNGNAMIEFTVGEFASITLNQNNTMLTQGILQPYLASAPLPVTGLQFTAKRISNKQVQLDWKTIQEMNNLGFHIERKKENETNFASLDFVKSKAFDGNSSVPLQYATVDMNDFTGITYYRLKQTDIDGKFTYSIICRVSGEANKSITLKAWPIPSQGDLTVMAEGIDKDVLQVFDATGRLVRQIPLTNATQEKVNRLSPGTYIIRLAGQKDIVQKVMVQ